MFPLTTQEQHLLERLNRHPHFKSQVESLLSIIETAGDDLVKADDAQQRVREEMRQVMKC